MKLFSLQVMLLVSLLLLPVVLGFEPQSSHGVVTLDLNATYNEDSSFDYTSTISGNTTSDHDVIDQNRTPTFQYLAA